MMLLPVLLLLPLGAPVRQDAAPAPVLPPALVRVAVRVDGVDEPFLASFGGGEPSAALHVYALSTEGRPGIQSVIGGHGRTAGPDGRSGLSFLFFVHFHEDGTSFFEAELLNDAITDPPGLLHATYRIEFGGRVVKEGTQDFPDQTGVGVHAGVVPFAPRADLFEAYRADLPAPELVGPVPRDGQDAAGGDPDPVLNTHQTGSPRNRYWAVEAAQYVFTGDRRFLARLMDFVMVQARRPYHLSEANGEPFFHARHPQAYFVEGRPDRQEPHDPLGRDRLDPAAFDTGRVNGWDHEHMNGEELYAAYVFCGSRVARRELVLIAEQLLSTTYVSKPGQHQHSSRAFGWVARLLVRAHQATGEERYLDGVRTMMGSLQAHWQSDGPQRALVSQPADPRHMANERFEAPFMVAVAASALALYLDEVPDDATARELLVFCGDLLVDQGWSAEGGGFFYDYSVESPAKAGDGKQTNGVVLFIVAPLIEVAERVAPERRAKYLDVARRLWQANRDKRWGKPSHPVYHQWLLRAVKEFEGK